MMKKNWNFFTKPANVVKTSMLLLVFFAVTTYVHGQTMTKVYNTTDIVHRFEVTGAKVTKIEVYGAGGAGRGAEDGGRGGGGGGYASLSGITPNHIAIGSILKVTVGKGGEKGSAGGSSSVYYGQGHVTADGGAGGGESGGAGGGGSTRYILDGDQYNSTTTVDGCTFTTHKGGNGGANYNGLFANYAGGGGGAAGPNGNGGTGETATVGGGNGDGGASGGGVGGAGGNGANNNNNGGNGGNYGGGGGGCKDNKTPGKGGTGYVIIHYTIVTSTVSFDAQGGTGAPSTLNDVTYGTKLGDSYSGNWIPTRPGYLFLGWNTEIDGSGEYYGPYSASAFETNTTLYAIWLKEIELEDMIVCKDEQIVLSDIPDGYSSFEWSPADAFSNTGSRTTLDASKLNEGSNTVTVTAIFDEVFNGDFNSGRQGIFSNYAFQVTPCNDKCMNPERRWAIVKTFSDGVAGWNSDFKGLGGEGDHFMMVNGGWVSPENGYGEMEAFWEQTVRVVPNQTYTFSFSMASMGTDNPARVYVLINGDTINTNGPFTQNDRLSWHHYTVQWNSRSYTSATIQLMDMEWHYPGNDFGIDGISFTCGASDISTTSSCTITVLPEVTAPTTITATAEQVCEGEDITFTATGGTGASDAIVWSETGCPQTAYINDFHQFDYSLNQTQDASVNSSGNLELTSTGGDPMITMYNLGSFDPNTYKYFQIRYRVTSGTANQVEIFFTNAQHATAAADQRIYGNLISDGEWHTLTIDASTHSLWTHSNITGWRYDYCTNSWVTMEIDFIALTNAPASGNTYTMSNLSQGTHTVYANRLSSCNSDPCITKQVSTYPEFNPGTINTTGQEICEGGTANPIGISTSASGGDGNISYQWYVDGIAISEATSDSYTPSSTYTSVAGTYTFTRKAKDNSCSDGQTSNGSYILIVNKAEVTLNDMSPVAICKGESTRLEATLNGTHTGSVSYQWTPATGLSSTTGSAVTANPTTTTTYMVTATANNNGCTAISTKTVTVTVNELPTLNVTPTDALCYGSNGKLTVDVGGSAPAYKIYMGGISGTPQTTLTAAGSHEISNLTPGHYTIAVEDGNGCQTTSAVQTINQPSALSLSSVTATDVKCNGGSDGAISYNVSGGTAGYTITITPAGQTTPAATVTHNEAGSYVKRGLTADTYTLSLTDAKGCTIAAQTATVGEPALLTANIASKTNVGCYGNDSGEITVEANGGTEPYQYKIDGAFSNNNTFSNRPAGNYTITIKDNNGCEASVSTSITQPAGTLNASIESQTNVSCKGGADGSVTILAQSGTAPYQYKLNDGSWQSLATFSDLSMNSYIATVKDTNGCEISLSVNITEPEQLAIVQEGGITAVRCKGESNGAFAFKVNGGTPNYTITIAGPAGDVALAPPVSGVYTQTGLAAGTYTVSVTDAKECTAEAVFSISEPAKEMTVTITGTTQESCDGSDATATALADGGNNGYTYLWSDGQTTAQAARLTTMDANNGVYYVTATDSKGCAATTSVTITLNNPLAMEDITGPVVCTGTEFSITPENGTNGTILDGTTYSWPKPDSIPGIGGLAAGADRPSINGVLTNNNSNPQTVSYTVTPKVGICVGNAVGVSVTVTTTVNPNVTITIPHTMTVCSNADTSLSATFVNSVSNSTVVWKKDKTIMATHTVTGNTDNYTIDLVDSICKGQYIYRVEYTDESGCTASDECTITVNSGGWSISQPAGDTLVECVSAAIPPAESLLPDVTDGCGRTTTRTLLRCESSPTEITCAGTVTYTYRYTACDETYKDWTYTYTINDVTDPTIAEDAITTKAANIDQTACTFSIPDLTDDIRAKASDNCTAADDLVISQSPAMRTVITAATDVVVTVTDKCGNSTTHTVNVTVPTLPTAAITVDNITNVDCNGNNSGRATVTPTNGTDPYTYLWSNGQKAQTASNLIAGNYSVTVIDANGCSTTADVTITEPQQLALDSMPASTPVDCHGNATGKASFTLQGGTTPYYVTLNGETKIGDDSTFFFDNLEAGTYTATIKDDNNCELTGVSVTITEPAALQLSITDSSSLCYDKADGYINYTFSGGTPDYTVSIPGKDNSHTAVGSGRFTDLADGSYTVTVTDNNGCSVSANATIEQINDTLTITAHSQTWTYDGNAHSAPSFDMTFGPQDFSDITSGSTIPLANGDTVHVTIDGSITYAGTEVNNIASVTVQRDGMDVTCYYNIVKTNGELVVNQNSDTLTLTCPSGTDITKMYDGDALAPVASVTGAIGSDVIAVEYSTDGTHWSATVPFITDAGTQTIQVRATNPNYETETCSYVLKVTKRPITLTSASDSKVYDGTALTNDNITIGGEGFVTGEGATYNVTGSQTDVDTSSNTFTYTLNSGTSADNYEITKTEGELSVTQLSITVDITGKTGTSVYDGEVHTVTGYDVAISDTLYTESDFTFSGDSTATRTDAGTTNMGLAASQFTNNNTNFNVTFNVEDGYQIIERALVTVTADNKQKNYDMTDPALTATITGLKGSDTESVINYTISRAPGEDLGDYEITVTGEAVQGNYNVTYVPGTFKIFGMPQELTITSASETIPYDGTLHTKPVYTVTFNGNTLTATNSEGTEFEMPITGDKLTITPTFTGVTNVTDANNVDNNNTFTYELENNAIYIGTRTVTYGTVKVTPITAEVTITGANNTTDYNGEVHTVTGYTATASTTLYNVNADFTFSGSASASRTDTGTTNMGLAESQFTNNNANFEVTFNVTDGYQTITANEGALTLTCPSGTDTTKVYDGAALKPAASVTGAIGSDVITIEYSTDGGTTWDTIVPGITHVGTQDVKVRAKNPNYVTETCEYTLAVTKRSVTLTSATASKEYDGLALTNDTVTVSGDGFVDGEGATYNVTGSQTNVGSCSNAFTYTLNSNTDANNYTIDKIEGTLTVTSNDDALTLTCPSGESITKMYDGAELAPVATVSSTIPDDTSDDFTIEYSTNGGANWSTTVPSITHVGTQPVKVRATNPNYVTVACDYTLEVTKRTVTVAIAGHTSTTEYNGAAHTVTGYDITSISNALYTSSDFTFSGSASASRTDTGTTNMGLAESQFTNNNANFEVTFNVTDGYQTITPKPLTITADSETKVYDGMALTKNSYTSTALASGDAITSITITGSQTVAGTSNNVPSAAVIKDGTEDVTSNYNITYTNGMLTVTPRPVTLTSATDSKIYDGTPLTNSTVTVGGDGFVAGEGATYDVTGTITDVGTVSNAFTYALNAGTSADNYKITKIEGVLEILVDNVPPGIGDGGGVDCEDIGDQVRNNDPSYNYYTHSGTSWNVTATDNSGAVPTLTWTLTGATTASGSTTLDGQKFYIGVTTVTWTAEDPAGNPADCSFNVTVNDITNPVLTCPTITTVYECLDEVPVPYANYAAFTTAGGTATDNHQINESSFAVTETEVTGCPTTITRTYSIKDMAGNEGTCTQVITVEDKTAPTIGTDDLDRTLTSTNCVFRIPDLTAEVRAISSDNCTDNASLVVTQSSAGMQVYPMATARDTIVSVTVTDACDKTSTKSVTITIPAKVTISASATPAVICNGETSQLNSTVANIVGTAVYEWTPDTGLSSTTIANPTATLTASGASATTTYTVQVTDDNGCAATATTSVTVNPKVVMNDVADQAICHGSEMAAVNFTTPITDGSVVYNWSRDNDSISGLAMSGTGNIAAATLTNTTNTAQTTTITVTPVYTNNGNECTDDSITFTITVNPKVVMNTVADWTLCVGETSPEYVYTSTITDGTVTYGWSNNTPAIGLAAMGEGNLPSFVAANATPANLIAEVKVAPTYANNGISCQGDSINFHITVRPSIKTPGNVTFTCPADTTVVLSYSECEQFVNIGEPEFENHMSGMNVNITNDAPEGNIFPEGTTIVTWTATDDCGAFLTCTQNVVVQFPSCGDSIADFDGYRYSSVRIGCQCWIGENARSEHYSDGTPVDNFRYYNDSDSLESVYGKLYSWYAAVRVPEGDDTAVPADSIDPLGNSYVQGICPEGWALPTVDEYMLMIANSGNATHAKDGSNLHWLPGYEGQSPLSGFDAFGAGMYNEALARYEGLLGKTYFWTTLNVPGSETATTVEINYYCAEGLQTELSKGDGVSIRCIRKR